ncbi:hypothetical protein KKA69_05310 [Patescibacteria group bacterium]|nr:hypothetical protein [Patescibacteria group bacterium]
MKKTKRIYQGFAVLISFAVIATGIRPLIIKNDMFYNNWWGGLVFAPLTIIVGLFLLYLVIFKWDKIMKMK